MSDGEPSPNGQNDEYAARNAAIERQFRGLPLAGSSAYWAALADATPTSRLELETLVRCARERRAAGAPRDVLRVFEILQARSRPKLTTWINRLIPQSARASAQVREEVAQECMFGLWRELDSDEKTFLSQGYWTRMWRMTTNIAGQTRIEEGVSARLGVERPARVPSANRDSLDRPASPEDDRPLADSVADPQSLEANDLSELINDIEALRDQLTSDERALLQNMITGELTQTEMGETLGGITERAVRMRRDKLRAKITQLLRFPDGRGDPNTPSGGARATGGS